MLRRNFSNILTTTLIVVFCANIPSLAQFTGGGTSSNPYLLLSRADMDTLVKYIETESNWTANKHFKLMVDIGAVSSPWTKIIGVYSTSSNANIFQGHFDGNNKKIYLNINNTTFLPGGLFLQIVNGSVKNLIIQGSVTGGLGASPLGGITGQLIDGNIDNCTNSATISGSQSFEVGGIAGNFAKINTSASIAISNCKDSGSVSGLGAGGIVGILNIPLTTTPVITGCVNFGVITATEPESFGAGGICGLNQSGLIVNSFNVGKVNATIYAGGIAGINYSTIERCINLGAVSATSHTGGIVGFNAGGSEVNFCMNAGLVNGGTKTGGICGYLSIYLTDPSPDPGPPPPPTFPSQTTYCLNVGVVESSSPSTSGAIVGAKIGTTATITHCYYDKQFTFIGGISNDDVPNQAESRYTIEMLGTGLSSAIGIKSIWSFPANNYPVISAIATTSYSAVASSPAVLDITNRRNSIDQHFITGVANDVTWVSRLAKITFTSGNAKLNLMGLDTIMCSKGDARKLLPIYILSVPQDKYFDVVVEAEPAVGGEVTGSGIYKQNAMATITAKANPYYTFKHWEELPSGTIFSTKAIDSVKIVKNCTFRAHFAIDSFTLTLRAKPDTMGAVAGTGTYSYGYSALFWATPKYGYHFVKWTDEDGELLSENTHNHVQILKDRELTAHFEVDTFKIKISVEHHSYGLAHINDSIPDSARFIYLTPVKITTKGNDTCFYFVGWTSKDDPTTIISSDPNFTLTLTSDTHIVAHYTEANRYVYLKETVNGVIKQNEAVKEFIGDGAYPCMPFATTDIDFVMNEGYKFVNWTEEATGKIVSPLQNFKFEVSKTTTFIANFIKDSIPVFIINLMALPEEGGDVIGSGAYPPGTNVSIEAKPNTAEGFKFISWRAGSTTISNNPKETITLTQDTLLTAFFSNEYTFSRSISPSDNEGYFTDESDPTGLYSWGKEITLIAKAFDTVNWGFIKWTSGAKTLGLKDTLIFTLICDTNITAVFDYIGIKELPEISSFCLSPNPTSTHFSMSLELLEDVVVYISLHDLAGNHIMQINEGYLPQGEWNKDIDISEFPSGSYFIKVSIGKNSYIEKLIIER